MKPFLILYLFMGTFFATKAQEVPTARLFENAKKAASSEKYDAAIKILEELTASNPENNDYKIYLARVYAWQKNYPRAISILKPLTEPPGVSRVALEVMVTTQFWAENYEEVIHFSDLALEEFPLTSFKMNKVKALEALGRNKKAMKILKEIIKRNPENLEALALQSIIRKKSTSHISLSYLNTSFSDPGFHPWHLSHLEYKQNVGSVPVLGRLNYGNLFGMPGTLFELDAYPKTSERSYLHLNAGATMSGSVFPRFKAGIEYFLSLKKGFAVSLGSKYLDFEENKVLLSPVGISYTPKNNLRINYKAYFTNTKNNWFVSHTLALRIMNRVKETFMQFDLHYGTIPYAFFTSSSFTSLTALRLGVQYQFRIGENFLLQPIFMYEYEEYFPSRHRNRFNSQIITTWRF